MALADPCIAAAEQYPGLAAAAGSGRESRQLCLQWPEQAAWVLQANCLMLLPSYTMMLRS